MKYCMYVTVIQLFKVPFLAPLKLGSSLSLGMTSAISIRWRVSKKSIMILVNLQIKSSFQNLLVFLALIRAV